MGGKSKSTTIGYRYFFDIHMLLGRGPVDELVEIQVGDLTAWQGSVTESGTIQIDAPDLFGGDAKEGGIVGPATIMMGEDTQAPPAGLVALLGGLVPSFRRHFTIFFSGEVCAMNPYPKTWSMRMRRAVKGWDGDTWYPAKAVIQMANQTIKAMNPAHILYECATNREWGRGLPRTLLDEDSFTHAANQLCDECFGICLRWNRQDDLDSFVQQIMDHIGAASYFDRNTGKWTIRLVRDDYDITTLPTFTVDSGLIDIAEDGTSEDSAVNEQIVTWHDPIDNQDKQVRVQNVGNMQAVGAIYSQTTSYPGLPTPDLAMRVAMRDLKAAGTPLKRYVVTLDRRAWKIAPGDVFVISVPSLDILSMVVRAGRIEDGLVSDGQIKITCVQDIFGLPSTTYQQVEPPQWVPPDTTPVAPPAHAAYEASYRDLFLSLSSSDLAALDPTSGTFETVVKKPTPLSLSYQLWCEFNGVSPYTKESSASFTPCATLADTLTTYGGSMTVTAPTDLSLVEVGSALLIEDEICEVTSVNLTTNVINVGRGCVDTLPKQHASGVIVWFYDGNVGGNGKEYTTGEVISTQYRTQTSSAVLDPSVAPIDSVTMTGRQYRPYPMGDLEVNGVLPLDDTASLSGDVVFTWAHRNRVVQQDKLVVHTDPDVTPEAGTTYNVRLYDSTDTLITQQTGITANTCTFVDGDLPGSGAVIRCEAEAERDGVISYQIYNFTFTHFAAGAGGWGFNYGNTFGE